jgi:hypothetical protein
MQIIIITGKKQSGKSTSSEVLMSFLPTDQCKVFSFADPLKEFLMNIFGLTKEQCYGSDADKNTNSVVKWKDLPLPQEEIAKLFITLKKMPDISSTISVADQLEFLTARELMQIFGSDICRRMYNDCWARATRINVLTKGTDYNFICDARFPNEIEWFKDLDPLVLRLNRNPFDDKHKSEIALNDYNWNELNRFIYIFNKGLSLDERDYVLKNQVLPLIYKENNRVFAEPSEKLC